MSTPTAVSFTITVTYDNGHVDGHTGPLTGDHPVTGLAIAITDTDLIIRARVEDTDAEPADRQPAPRIVALDQKDPGNTDADELTAPLDPDDDVYTLVQPDRA